MLQIGQVPIHGGRLSVRTLTNPFKKHTGGLARNWSFLDQAVRFAMPGSIRLILPASHKALLACTLRLPFCRMRVCRHQCQRAMCVKSLSASPCCTSLQICHASFTRSQKDLLNYRVEYLLRIRRPTTSTAILICWLNPKRRPPYPTPS